MVNMDLDLAIWRKRERLLQRLPLLEERRDRLSDLANAYEEATESSPETDARLDRLTGLAGRADHAVQTLEERARLLQVAANALEEEDLLRDERSK